MKLLLLVDANIDDITKLWNAIQIDGEEIPSDIELDYDVDTYDFSALTWENTGFVSYGDAKGMHNWVKAKYGDKFDFVECIVSEPNWKTQGIGGMHMGVYADPNRENAMAIDFIRFNPDWSAETTALAVKMEKVHSFDSWWRLYQEEGNIEDLFDVSFRFDHAVVHGEDPKWNAYDYYEVYQILKPYILKWFPQDKNQGEQKDMAKVDKAKLVQITNELLIRDPKESDDGYIGMEEEKVREMVGKTGERARIIRLVNAARGVK